MNSRGTSARIQASAKGADGAAPDGSVMRTLTTYAGCVARRIPEREIVLKGLLDNVKALRLRPGVYRQ